MRDGSRSGRRSWRLHFDPSPLFVTDRIEESTISFRACIKETPILKWISAAVTAACAWSGAPLGRRESAELCIAGLRRVLFVATIAIALQAASARSAIAGEASFGNETVSNGCDQTAAINVASYYQCLDAEEDQERKMLDSAVERARSTAMTSAFTRRFAPAIENAEGDWIKWMSSECSLEGLIGGGSAAPTPWLERCELRLIKERLATIASLQSTLEKLIGSTRQRGGDTE
jgi:uncharacterized protein YecT (DUF1311 family)